MGQTLDIKYSYPNNPDYEYETMLELIDLDLERKQDVSMGRGFIVTPTANIKKDIKNIDGIFSTRFGQTLDDVNPYADRYKCECGNLRSRLNHGIRCEICKTLCKYVDDDFKYFGWIVLKDEYHIIHPNIYNSLASLIGSKRLLDIIKPKDEKDQDGKNIAPTTTSKDNPFSGIGMMEFKERFQEIIDYFYTRSYNRKDVYDHIMNNIDIVFTHSIPVYTTHLRPYKVEGDNFHFETTNKIYVLLCKLVGEVNKTDLKLNRKKKPKNELLFDIQIKFNELYGEIIEILKGKKGSIRTLFGGRYAFSSRCVIVPNPKLRVDEVTLPYKALVTLLQHSIINILKKSYNMTYSDAYNMWYKSLIKKDETVYKIIEGLIKDKDRGLPIIINRNPTINYGGVLQMFVVGIVDNYTMGVPLQILPLLAADFDGDVLNIFYIINQAFFERAFAIFNPRNAMYISRNDGKFNNSMNHCRDTIINSNTLINLSRKYYSPEQIQKIQNATRT